MVDLVVPCDLTILGEMIFEMTNHEECPLCEQARPLTTARSLVNWCTYGGQVIWLKDAKHVETAHRTTKGGCNLYINQRPSQLFRY